MRLEPLQVQHQAGLVAASTESRDSYGLTWVPGDAGSMLAYIKEAHAAAAAGTESPYAIRRIADGALVGATRYLDILRWSGRADPDADPDAVEIGHTWYAASAQRTAANTEAKLLLLTQAFEQWQVVRVVLKTDARNTRSRNAIERIGATFEGVRRATGLAWDGTVRDTAYFSITAPEWPAARAALQARLQAGAR